MQPTSLVGVAYQLLSAMNWSCMDDEVDAAVDKRRFGAADDLLERTDTVQNTVLSAYRGLRPLIHDADLVVVEAPHCLRGWKPNQSVSALLEAQYKKAFPIGIFCGFSTENCDIFPDRDILT